MILAPAQMAAHSDPKVAAAKCFEEIALDPDNYRIGHTKASWRTLDKNGFDNSTTSLFLN